MKLCRIEASMVTSRNERITMNQLINHSAPKSRRPTRNSYSRLGFVAVGALLLGSTGLAAATTAKTVTITAAQNGRVITVAQGSRIVVNLANVNWTFSTQGTRKVVTLVSTTVTKGATPGATQACVPGRSCASVRAVYFALEPGLMRLIALRTSCGTGVTCSASQSHWTVVVRVR